MGSSILVLGAGELGLSILTALSRHPLLHSTKVSALVRQSTLDSAAPDKKLLVQRLEDLKVGTEAADVVAASASELVGIFRRYETIVSCNGMGLPPGTQLKLLDAVLEAGKKRGSDDSDDSGSKTRRYFPWQFGMDYDIIGHGSSQDLFDEQLKVRERLRAQSDVDWTIVSTGLFMSFLFVPEFGVVDVDEKVVRALGSWGNEITVTTPEDIGRVTADVILDPRDIHSEVVYTAGDTISYGALADLLDGKSGAEFHRELWDLDELRQQMEKDPTVMVKYRDTFAQGRGVAWGVEGTVNRKRGMEMTDVSRYLEQVVLKDRAD